MTQDESIVNPFVQLVHPKKEQYLPQFFYEEEMEALFQTVEQDSKRAYEIGLLLNYYMQQEYVCLN